jgi:hypothetical protein
MIFRKLPRRLQKIAHFSVLAAAISLVAISANAGNYKAKKGIGDTASSNEVINVIDEVILPN